MNPVKAENPDFAGKNPMKLTLKITVGSEDPKTVSELLAQESNLSRRKIKNAMVKGAVWLKTSKGRRRIRRSTRAIRPDDKFEFYYDDQLLALEPPQPVCLEGGKHYSVWIKPAGLLSQGTLYGDHCSLLRIAERHFENRLPVFPVHRLDREAFGLILIAHSKNAASRLSRMIQDREIRRVYTVRILGKPADLQENSEIALSLDGKKAITRVIRVAAHPDGKTALAEVELATGRTHQIRRHFDMIGHPVMGDPRYGSGNKTPDGLQLAAVRLSFACPFTREDRQYILQDVDLPEGLRESDPV